MPAAAAVGGESMKFAAVRRLLLSPPGVEEGSGCGTPGYRLRGQFLARLRDDGHTIVVKCGRTGLRRLAPKRLIAARAGLRGFPRAETDGRRWLYELGSEGAVPPAGGGGGAVAVGEAIGVGGCLIAASSANS